MQPGQVFRLETQEEVKEHFPESNAESTIKAKPF